MEFPILIVFMALAVWVWSDANKRNMLGIFWGIATFFLPIIIAIYLVMRKPITSTDLDPNNY